MGVSFNSLQASASLSLFRTGIIMTRSQKMVTIAINELERSYLPEPTGTAGI